jgi:putative ABC transport system permease protein
VTPRPRPPAWLESLQERLLPEAVREEVAGDLREEWEAGLEAGRSPARLTLAAVRHTLVIAASFTVRGGGGGDSSLRSAARRILRAPGLAGTVVAGLALGVAGNTAILALAEAVLLRPLPFPASERLGMVSYDFSGSETDGFGLAWRDVEELRERAGGLDAVAGILDWQHVDLAGSGEPVRVPASFVGPRYLELLGVEPLEGRLFGEDENGLGDARAVVLLAAGLWRDAFGSDPSLLGSTVTLNGLPFTVVGVLPDERSDLRQRLGARAGLVLPLLTAESLLGEELRERRGSGALNALVRLREGRSWEQVGSELDRISGELAATFPDSNEGWSYHLESLAETFHGELRAPVAVLLGGAVLVFLLVAFNLSSLLAIRGVERRREAAVRRALGARGDALVRLVLHETLLLAVVGGALGLLAGRALLDGIRGSGLLDLPSFTTVSLTPRVVVISVTFLVALATLLVIVGSLPMLRGGVDRLRDGTRGTSDRGTSRLRGLLVAGEVALAFTLLVGAGLMLRSLDTLRGTGHGFDTDRMMTLRMELRGERWSSDDALRSAADELVTGGRGLEGVEEAFLWSPHTLGQASWVDLLTRVDRWDLHPAERLEAYRHHVLPGTLSRAGLDIVRGRDIEMADDAGARDVALVSESLARALWPGEDPLEQRIESRPAGAELRVREVVGVVEDARHRSRLIDPFGPQLDVYYPFAQWPMARLSLAVRLAPGADAETVASGVREVARAIDSDVPVFEVATFEQRMRDEEARARLTTLLVVAYAVLAALLAALGIYGVLARAVRDRTREIGVRMALGADRRTVVADVVRGGAVPLAAGAVAGGLLALVASRVAAAALYGVSPRDPVAFGLAAAVLALIGVIAVAGPALRASRVKPARALAE